MRDLAPMRLVMCFFCASLGLGLAACDLPSTHFAGVAPTRVVVGGSTFDVRVRGTLAEAVRVNPQYAPRLGRLAKQSALAMETVSGCKVLGVLGDQAVQVAELSCGSIGPAVLRPSARYDCMEIPSGVERENGTEYLDYDCSPY